ncbi:MAG: hypothetical protein HY078_09715 [Elusimicrobia bacterium]|nr:hypothetical protein [Elusimicrobiota bacterium]
MKKRTILPLAAALAAFAVTMTIAADDGAKCLGGATAKSVASGVKGGCGLLSTEKADHSDIEDPLYPDFPEKEAVNRAIAAHGIQLGIVAAQDQTVAKWAVRVYLSGDKLRNSYDGNLPLYHGETGQLYHGVPRMNGLSVDRNTEFANVGLEPDGNVGFISLNKGSGTIDYARLNVREGRIEIWHEMGPSNPLYAGLKDGIETRRNARKPAS